MLGVAKNKVITPAQWGHDMFEKLDVRRATCNVHVKVASNLHTCTCRYIN